MCRWGSKSAPGCRGARRIEQCRVRVRVRGRRGAKCRRRTFDRRNRRARQGRTDQYHRVHDAARRAAAVSVHRRSVVRARYARNLRACGAVRRGGVVAGDVRPQTRPSTRHRRDGPAACPDRVGLPDRRRDRIRRRERHPAAAARSDVSWQHPDAARTVAAVHHRRGGLVRPDAGRPCLSPQRASHGDRAGDHRAVDDLDRGRRALPGRAA